MSLDLYFASTPNGWKITIFFEELAELGEPLDWKLIPVNLGTGDQFKPEFLAISPNNRMPALVDHDAEGGPLSIFESGAILIYLAEKTGVLWPPSTAARYDMLQWLFFQNANVGPMFGQCGHFQGYAPEPVPYAIERYHNETRRLYRVMDRRLATSEYLAGDAYSLADVATYPWCMPIIRDLHRIDIEEFPYVGAWVDRVAARPAVTRGTSLLADAMKIGDPDEETREAFFGNRQLEQR